MLVPTMGALHEGHASLVFAAAGLSMRERGTGGAGAAPVVVSIFVNPTQFNDPRDLARYPRTLDSDVRLCQQAFQDGVRQGWGGGGAASGTPTAAGFEAGKPNLIIFAPMLETMYPTGTGETVPVPPLPPVATEPGLEDAHRPGHFAGVCQVVSRLFDLTRPSHAVFGEKDWQQLQVIRAMTQAQGRATRVVACPTVREEGNLSGLAMSSRNVFLSVEDRLRARVLSQALDAATTERTPAEAEETMSMLVSRAGLEVEYAVVRHAETLMPVTADDVRQGRGPWRSLIAARLMGVRLIDNAAWTPA